MAQLTIKDQRPAGGVEPPSYARSREGTNEHQIPDWEAVAMAHNASILSGHSLAPTGSDIDIAYESATRANPHHTTDVPVSMGVISCIFRTLFAGNDNAAALVKIVVDNVDEWGQYPLPDFIAALIASVPGGGDVGVQLNTFLVENTIGGMKHG